MHVALQRGRLGIGVALGADLFLACTLAGAGGVRVEFGTGLAAFVRVALIEEARLGTVEQGALVGEEGWVSEGELDGGRVDGLFIGGKSAVTILSVDGRMLGNDLLRARVCDQVNVARGSAGGRSQGFDMSDGAVGAVEVGTGGGNLCRSVDGRRGGERCVIIAVFITLFL